MKESTAHGTWDPTGRSREGSGDAQAMGLWIRCYTLNGHDATDPGAGWSSGYNFGSKRSVTVRWKAAIEAGADFIATDQYEDFAAVLEPSSVCSRDKGSDRVELKLHQNERRTARR